MAWGIKCPILLPGSSVSVNVSLISKEMERVIHIQFREYGNKATGWHKALDYYHATVSYCTVMVLLYSVLTIISGSKGHGCSN